MGDNIEELRKQKEDIEILLSTLEEAYGDASITEEHYNEVKGKNQKRLEELDKEIASLEAASPAKQEEVKEPAKPGSKTRKPKQAKKPKGKSHASKPVSQPPAETHPATSPDSPATITVPPAAVQKGEPQTDYSGIPQPLTDVAGADEPTETSPDNAPGGVRSPPVQPGSIQYTASEIKEMLNKIIKEIKPQGIEVIPRVDKLEVGLEKMRAYIEAMKDARSTGKEDIQRINQELGEVRSNVSTVDRKVSESEIKVHEINEAMGDMRPQRFIMALQEEDKSIKVHDARLDKLDDLNSVMLKKLGQIEGVLKRLGSLEKIVNFSKEAAKRLLEIENREKRINRIADKIDGIFMDLNKRLDEFVLYKAKQDTLDELSQEMMKSLDDISTKVEKYASRDDLDMFKSSIEAELANMRTRAGTSPAVQKLRTQKTEIEGLIAMLDEQFKVGALPEKEYKKTKEINQARLADIDKKITAAPSGTPTEGQVSKGTQASKQNPEDWAARAGVSPGAAPAEPGASKPAPSGTAPEGKPSETTPPAEKPPEASQPTPAAPQTTPGEPSGTLPGTPTDTQRDAREQLPKGTQEPRQTGTPQGTGTPRVRAIRIRYSIVKTPSFGFGPHHL